MSQTLQQTWHARDIGLAKNDMAILRAWLRGNPLTPNGIVSQSLAEMIKNTQNCIEKEEAMIAAANSFSSNETSGSGWRIKIRTPDLQTIYLVAVSPNTTMYDLKSMIESSLERPINFARIRVTRTGQVFSTFDSSTLESCGIQNNDVLSAELASTGTTGSAPATSTSSSTSNQNQSQGNNASKAPPSPLSRMVPSGIWPANRFQAILLALHCCMLDSGFVCVAEVPSSVPGFAPPLRELGMQKLLPEKWCADSTVCAVMYKHPRASGKQFSLSLVLLGVETETLLVTISQKGGLSFTAELSGQDYLSDVNTFAADNRAGSMAAEGMDVLFNDFAGLQRVLGSLISQLLPSPVQAQPQTPQSIPPSTGTNSVPSPIGSREPLYGRDSRGNGDLDPFGGGSLIGPNHSIFTNPRPMYQPEGPTYPPYPTLPGAGGVHPMQPRFDPFGPPLNPNFGGGGLGGVVPGRAPRVPGEPNPDHMVPPDMDVDPFLGPNTGRGRGGPGRGRGFEGGFGGPFI